MALDKSSRTARAIAKNEAEIRRLECEMESDCRERVAGGLRIGKEIALRKESMSRDEFRRFLEEIDCSESEAAGYMAQLSVFESLGRRVSDLSRRELEPLLNISEENL